MIAKRRSRLRSWKSLEDRTHSKAKRNQGEGEHSTKGVQQDRPDSAIGYFLAPSFSPSAWYRKFSVEPSSYPAPDVACVFQSDAIVSGIVHLILYRLPSGRSFWAALLPWSKNLYEQCLCPVAYRRLQQTLLVGKSSLLDLID